MGDEGEKVCPVCAEEMDLTDQQLKPCKCGFEICVWCWHQIIDMAEKDDTDGRCPACRTPYDKEKIVGMAANCERVVAEINSERRLKSQKAKSKTPEGRKHLSSVRVIQRNLVYIIGIPVNLADEDTLEKKEFFGQYGRVQKVSISRPTTGGQHSCNNNTCNVYVTYSKEEEAVRCIQSVHGFILEGRSLRACYGTTKYCHTWLRNMPCNNPDCLYLHDIGTQEDSFTKDEIISAFTRSRALQIAGASNNLQRRSGNTLPPPADEFCNIAAASSDKLTVKNKSNNPADQSKVSPPNVSTGRSSILPAAASWGLRVSNYQKPTSSNVDLQVPASEQVETFTGSSALYSMVGSSAQATALHAVGKTSTLEYSKQQIGSKCETPKDKPTEVLLDATCASVNSEYLARQPSCSSGLFDGTIQSLCSGLSPVDGDTLVGVEYRDISKQSSSVSAHLSAEVAGNAVAGVDQCSPDHGIDMIEPLTSLSLGKSATNSEATHVSRESKWGTGFQRQGLPTRSSETDELLLPVDQLSEAFTHPLHLPDSRSPLETPNRSSDQINTACASGPGISDSRAADAIVDEMLHGFTNGGSALSNGIGVSNTQSGELYERSDVLFDAEKFRYLGGSNWASHVDDKAAGSELGESTIISNILSMDFDAWDGSLTHSLTEFLSDTGIENGSIRLSSSRKQQNSSQSRFSFARQEDFVNGTTCLEPSSSNTEHVQLRNCAPLHSLEDRESYVDKLQNGYQACSFEHSENAIRSDSILPSYKVSVSRAQISVPPGFTVPSKAAPPGFSSQPKTDWNQLGSPSILSSQHQLPPLAGSIGSMADVEFIDPAILAVSKGRFPLSGMSNSGLDSASIFQPELTMSKNDPRIQLLMQPSKSSHRNFQYSDCAGDTFTHLNDAYMRSRLAEQNQILGSGFNHHHLTQLSSLQQSRNVGMSNRPWDSWNEIQTGTDLATAGVIRNERLGLDKYTPGYEELRFHRSSMGDLYSRAFGM